MYHLLPGFITAFLVTYFAIPSIIKIAHEKNLCDEPGERRSHAVRIPTLGGLGIFAGLIFSVMLWIPFNLEIYPSHQYIQYILAAYIIIFLIGAKDDIIPLSPVKKLIGQVLAAGILVVKAKIKLSSLYGVLGIYDLPDYIALPFSVFVILVIINALNLIDGINGLAGSIGVLVCLSFGTWFYLYGRLDLAVLSAALMGALVAFLKYNTSNPARIFMGDTGSLLIGITSAILAISFIELNKHEGSVWHLPSVPALAIAVLIIPLFDTLRVFTVRILRGRSPFSPDRNHVHHLLLDLGLGHLQATGLLVLVNLGFIVLAYSLRHLGTPSLALIILCLALVLTGLLYRQVQRRRLFSHKS